MGNGFPMAAVRTRNWGNFNKAFLNIDFDVKVITRPEIADLLAQALHFNTFGGNPVNFAYKIK